MKRVKSLAALNLLTLMVQISFSYLAQSGLISQQNVGEISEKYNSLFTPAGITFAIWGVIYTTLGVFCLYHVILAFKHDSNHPANKDILQMNGWFVCTNLAAAAWLIAWTNDRMLISLALIVIQLLSLLVIHQRLKIVDRSRESGSVICTQWPLSIYLAWISIATIANASIWLVSIGWDGMGIGDSYWTMILIAIALIIGLFMILVRKNVSFGLVLVWAFYGIILKRTEPASGSGGFLVIILWTALCIIGAASLFQFFRNLRYRRPGPHFPEAEYSLK